MYEHAAIAYIEAIGLWVVLFGMLPLNMLEDEQQKKLIDILANMDKWFEEACENAVRNITASDGQSQRQSIERWKLRDVRDDSNNNTEFTNQFEASQLKSLGTEDGRKKLSNQIEFWQGSYLWQQLVSMTNWAYTVRNILKGGEPIPLKQYRMPLFCTRSLIFSTWNNARDQLEQVELLRRKLGSEDSIYVEEIIEDLNDKKKDFSADDNKKLKIKECYYIVASKAVHNFYRTLHYTRILTDNNQSLMFPPTAFILTHLWRLLYGLVEYETDPENYKDKENNLKKEKYEKARLKVQNEFRKYISKEIPSSHLDLTYITERTLQQLKAGSTMGDICSTTRLNILKNKYYLNDDYEDPMFHFDWTMIQMLTSSASIMFKVIDGQSKNLVDPHNRAIQDRRQTHDRRCFQVRQIKEQRKIGTRRTGQERRKPHKT